MTAPPSHTRAGELESVHRLIRHEQLCYRAVHEWGAVQHAAELVQLLGWLSRRLELETVVEIGVYKGGTMTLWAAAGAELVVGVDIGLECRPCELRQAHNGCPFTRARAAGVLFEADSHEPATVELVARTIAAAGDYPVDFLFIDGDHSRESVARDLELWAPLVRPGGAIALHDVVYDERIAALWREELSHGFVIYEPGGFGIGVLPC